MSSRPSRDTGPGASRRRVSQPRRSSGRGPGGTWSGSSHWSPYQKRGALLPRILLVAGVVVVLLAGSVLVASRFTDLGAGDDTPGGTAVPGVALSGSPTPTAKPAGALGTPVAGSPVIGSPTATVTVQVGDLRSPQDVAKAYAEVWTAQNFDQLYDLLSSNAQTAISREDFINRYNGINIEVGVVSLTARSRAARKTICSFPSMPTSSRRASAPSATTTSCRLSSRATTTASTGRRR